MERTITERVEKILIAVTDDDQRYIIYDAHDLIEKVNEDPQFVNKLLERLAEAFWAEAFDQRGQPVWIRTSTIVRVEYKEVKIRKG